MKKTMVIVGVVIIILVAIVLGVILFNGNTKPKAEDLNAYMEQLGKDFYKEFHADLAKEKNEEEVKSTLSNYKTNGLKVTLDSLSRLDLEKTDEIDDMFEKCDRENTVIYVFPKEPYAAKDFTLTVELDCDL